MSPQGRHPWIRGATCSVEGLCPPHLVKDCTLAFVFPTLKLNAVVISYHMFTAIFLIVKLRKKWTYASPKTQVLSISRKNGSVFFLEDVKNTQTKNVHPEKLHLNAP